MTEGAPETEARSGTAPDGRADARSAAEHTHARPGDEPMGTDGGPRAVIRVRGVRLELGGHEILGGIDLDVLEGETMVVMGGSGAGKSTLLRLMIGSFAPSAGSIELFGDDICCMDEPRLNETRKRFGILFQSGALFQSMTVAENVALPIREHTDLDPEIIDIQVQIKLELVGLREHANKYPAEISGGMKKRAGLARALALDPRILFYDEPTAGLDPVTSAQIDRLIMNLSKKLGVTSVVVTHEMASAFTVADRMAMLSRGRLLAVEPRSWYERLRDTPAADAVALDPARKLIRQFLRGEPEGTGSEGTDIDAYETALLGEAPHRPPPSVRSTRD